VLAVRPGELTTGIDFVLDPVASFRVAGRVDGPDGPLRRAKVTLTNQGTVSNNIWGDFFSQAVASTDSTGRFVMPAVPAGDYELRTEYYPVNGADGEPTVVTTELGFDVITRRIAGTKPVSDLDPLLEAQVTLLVDREVTDLNLHLERAPSVNGALRFDGSRGAPPSQELARAVLSLQPVDRLAAVLRAPFDGSGASSLSLVKSGQYRIQPPRFAGWTLQSIHVNGEYGTRSLLDLGCCTAVHLVFTYTDRLSSITGVITNAAGELDADSFVFVFPASSRARIPSESLDTFQILRTTSSGTFNVGSLKAADYVVVAVADASFDFDWLDIETMELLERYGTRVSPSTGMPRHLMLRSVRIPR
jgi:hypothetical protein